MKDKIKNAIKEFFKKEETETAKEVEERLMKVIRKLYIKLEQSRNEITDLKYKINNLNNDFNSNDCY
jgi:uncharacterized protein YpuA (DUF1002 family)